MFPLIATKLSEFCQENTASPPVIISSPIEKTGLLSILFKNDLIRVFIYSYVIVISQI